MVEVIRKPEGTLVLRSHLGKGEADGVRFDFGFTSTGLYFHFPNEYSYTVSFRSIIRDVLKFREEER